MSLFCFDSFYCSSSLLHFERFRVFREDQVTYNSPKAIEKYQAILKSNLETFCWDAQSLFQPIGGRNYGGG